MLTPRGPLSQSTSAHPASAPLLASPSFAQNNLAASVATAESDYPVPFIALTQTIEGASLTADLRLLRAVFKESEEAEMVYAVGNGGLRGIWEGEEGVDMPESRSGSRERGIGDADADDEDEWQQVEKEDVERGRRERREMARRAGEGGRVLLKCICLDLWAYGLGMSPILCCGLLVARKLMSLGFRRQDWHRRAPRGPAHRGGHQPLLHLHLPVRAPSFF